MTVAIPSAMYIARGSWRFGSPRSFAVNVITPNPRNAKNVRATLETMSLNDGYFDGARRSGSTFAIVETAKITRIPMTTTTTIVCARATTCDPRMFTSDITTITSTANTFAHVASPSVNDELA